MNAKSPTEHMTEMPSPFAHMSGNATSIDVGQLVLQMAALAPDVRHQIAKEAAAFDKIKGGVKRAQTMGDKGTRETHVPIKDDYCSRSGSASHEENLRLRSAHWGWPGQPGTFTTADAAPQNHGFDTTLEHFQDAVDRFQVQLDVQREHINRLEHVATQLTEPTAHAEPTITTITQPGPVDSAAAGVELERVKDCAAKDEGTKGEDPTEFENTVVKSLVGMIEEYASRGEGITADDLQGRGWTKSTVERFFLKAVLAYTERFERSIWEDTDRYPVYSGRLPIKVCHDTP